MRQLANFRRVGLEKRTAMATTLDDSKLAIPDVHKQVSMHTAGQSEAAEGAFEESSLRSPIVTSGMPGVTSTASS